MRIHGSLKQKLLFLALTSVIVVSLAAAIFTYYDASEEFGEILDAHLAQSAALLALEVAHNPDHIETESSTLLHEYSGRVVFQVWERGHVLRLHSVNAPEQPLADRSQGFSDNVIDGDRWRVYSTWDEPKNNLIHVAELSKDRDELSRDIAGNLLKPLWLSLPLLTFLLWAAVTRSLRPLFNLTSELAHREPDNLAPLNAKNAPQEVVPLIERINSLFTRIDASIQKERRFTADAAHELRTPVAGIKAQAQVARTASSETERIHALDNVVLGCDRAAHLIDQLLTLARIDTIDDKVAEPCQLRAIAAEVIATIAPTALDKNVRLELMDGQDAVVRGYPVLLRILLRNLIDNAVRHSPPDTSVRVSIVDKREHICLSVIDNGPGIPESELDKVMERFYRPLGTSASGSGLGLSIVKRIADIHAASLHLATQKDGKGLCVEIVFKS